MFAESQLAYEQFYEISFAMNRLASSLVEMGSSRCTIYLDYSITIGRAS